MNASAVRTPVTGIPSNGRKNRTAKVGGATFACSQSRAQPPENSANRMAAPIPSTGT